jgi:hypothetical protein
VLIPIASVCGFIPISSVGTRSGQFLTINLLSWDQQRTVPNRSYGVGQFLTEASVISACLRCSSVCSSVGPSGTQLDLRSMIISRLSPSMTRVCFCLLLLDSFRHWTQLYLLRCPHRKLSRLSHFKKSAKLSVSFCFCFLSRSVLVVSVAFVYYILVL